MALRSCNNEIGPHLRGRERKSRLICNREGGEKGRKREINKKKKKKIMILDEIWRSDWAHLPTSLRSQRRRLLCLRRRRCRRRAKCAERVDSASFCEAPRRAVCKWPRLERRADSSPSYCLATFSSIGGDAAAAAVAIVSSLAASRERFAAGMMLVRGRG